MNMPHKKSIIDKIPRDESEVDTVSFTKEDQKVIVKVLARGTLLWRIFVALGIIYAGPGHDLLPVGKDNKIDFVSKEEFNSMESKVEKVETKVDRVLESNTRLSIQIAHIEGERNGYRNKYEFKDGGSK